MHIHNCRPKLVHIRTLLGIRRLDRRYIVVEFLSQVQSKAMNHLLHTLEQPNARDVREKRHVWKVEAKFLILFNAILLLTLA